MVCPEDGRIRVRRDTMVTVEGGRPAEHRNAYPVTTTIRSTPTPQGSRPKSFPGLPGSSNLINDMLRSDTLSRKRKKTAERDTTKELIAFFRETSPPPGNYMSTPDTFDEKPKKPEKPEKRVKRFSLWPFHKRSRRNRESQRRKGLIRLPDSAVAGRTTGGYRHIAISIPIESLGLELLRRPSTPESFYTTTSELISSDAVTVHIPSPSWSPDLSNSPRTVDLDAETDSYFTPELAHSPLTISGRDTGDAYSLSGNSSPQFNFSAPYNGSTSRTSSMHEPALPYPTFDANEPYQPHALSDISSLESLLPSSLGSQPFHIEPFMTPANVQPPSPLHHADSNNERHPRRVHALDDIRSANHSHSSLLPLSQPREEEEDDDDEKEGGGEPTTHGPGPGHDHGILTPTTNPSRYPSSHPSFYPLPTTPTPGSAVVPHTPSHMNMNKNMNLLHSYTTLARTREREMDALLARLDKLEQANNTWLGTLVPLLERVSRRLDTGVTGAGALSPSGSMGRSIGGRGRDLGWRGWPSSLLSGYGGGGGGGEGEGVGFGLREGYGRGHLGYGEGQGQSQSQSLGQGYGHDGGGITPARLGSMLSVDSFDWGRVGDLRHRGPGGLGAGSSGSMGRGLRDSGVVGDRGDEEWEDINEESWLRSDSGSGECCSAWASREVVLNGYSHGALRPLGRWRSRSGASLRAVGGWGTTFAGREAEAFVREQQRQSDDWVLGYEEELGDAAGWGALEVLMRDLVLGASTRDQSVEGRTLVDDSMLEVWHSGSNDFGG
ncbi:hypothetical protein C8A01DRAFT_32100 [Parachaetomium inaequale]|uniref:Uncharacterized protein n=1 Tax=Parachaetomium inaequale TaxID=2588326 RepID=A0AAN6PMN4_9PEZI|nr:hypothetical protein C8A01DRAFT_32100 [Parachaetomium inaequale]